MGAIIAGAVIAAGGAVYAANQSSNASKDAANAMGNVQQFKPKMLGAPSLVDYTHLGQQTTASNFANLPTAESLAAHVNQFQQGQALKGYSRFQPYFQQNQELIGRNAASFARGELPSDVVGSIGRAAAQRGLEGGFGMGVNAGGGGGALGSLNLRNLGLSSLDLSKWGTQFAQETNKAGAAMMPGLFDPASQFTTPALTMNGMQFNANAQNQVAQLNAGYANVAGLQNTSLANSVAQQQALLGYQSALGQGQAIQGAGNTVAGLLSQYSQQQQALKMQQNYMQQNYNGGTSGYGIDGANSNTFGPNGTTYGSLITS